MMKRFLATSALAGLLAFPAGAQIVTGNTGSGGGGSGTVTSITAGNGINLTTNPCIATCTIATTVTNNAQTGATYAVLSTDGGKVVSASNSSSEAYSIAAANTAGFTSGFGFDLNNIGAGVTTLTATTSLFDNGTTSLAITQGQDAYIYSDGANYHSILSLPVMATNTYLGNTSGAPNYPTAQTFGAGVATALGTAVSGSGAICLASGSACAGGGGTPGGSTTQLQYNNAGSFGGITGITTNGSNLAIATAGAASTPALYLTGAPFAGTGTTSFPQVYVNNGATPPTSFNVSGTQFGGNSASTSGDFFNFYANGSQKAVLSGFGVLYLAGVTSGSCSTAVLCTNGPIQATTFITAGTNFTAGATGAIGWSGRGSITSAVAGNVQFGLADVAAPVAQTLSMQSVVAGTSNIAGANAILDLSRGTGSGVGGNLTVNCAPSGAAATVQNTFVACLTINGNTGLLAVPLISSDATHTDASVCEDTTSHALYSGSGTLGICLGTSSARYKHGITDLAMGLPEIMALKPKAYYLNKDHGDPRKQLYGFMAEDVVKVLPKLVGLDKKGQPNTADYLGMIPVLVKAVQQQQVEIAALQKKLAVRR